MVTVATALEPPSLTDGFVMLEDMLTVARFQYLQIVAGGNRLGE